MKKLNKFFAVLVALAMMATLCVSMAFASDGDEGTTTKTTTAVITKTLTVPEGTAIPDDATATFTFSNPTFNGGAVDKDDPTIETATLKLDTDASKTKTTDTDKNVDKYNYTISDVLAGADWQRPGVYTWDVVEATYVADDDDDATNDQLIKDETKYQLQVKVIYAKSEDGSDDTTKLVVDEVLVKKGTDTTEQGDDGTSTTTTSYNTKADGLAFENAYYTTTGNPGTKTDDKGTEDTDDDEEVPDETKPGNKDNDGAGLSVEKVVEGTYGDKETQFEITVNVSLPQIAGADTASAVIRRADGTIDAQPIVNGDNKILLASGDKLVFTKIAEGTKYTVKESDTRVGTAANQYKVTGEVEDLAVEKDADAVTITNKSNQDSVTPTGILINNLPYIALALVAIGGLVAYVVIRRRDNENA